MNIGEMVGAYSVGGGVGDIGRRGGEQRVCDG